jgi:quercetin dioxygenase-like cupin family protein
MKNRRKADRKTWMLFAAAVIVSIGAAAQPRTRTVISNELPVLDGSHLHATVVEVTYPAGGKSLPHSHPCPVIGYVLEGAVRMQIAGKPEVIYKTGESFYEAPNGLHQISENASSAEPAKFLAWFICDHETPLSISAPQSQSKGDQ